MKNPERLPASSNGLDTRIKTRESNQGRSQRFPEDDQKEADPNDRSQVMRDRLVCQLLRQQIDLATEALYSEQFDIEALIQRLSHNQGGVCLLRVYVAIQAAARLTEPLTDADVDGAFDAVRISEAHSESPEFPEILDMHRELAGVYWSMTQLAILSGKLARENNEESYEGTIYELQHEHKGPVSIEQRAQYEPLCKRMADLSRQIEEAELEAWKKPDEEEYCRYRDELDARALKAEMDANSDESVRRQCEEVVSMLEEKLNTLLHKTPTVEPDTINCGNCDAQVPFQSYNQQIPAPGAGGPTLECATCDDDFINSAASTEPDGTLTEKQVFIKAVGVATSAVTVETIFFGFYDRIYG